MRHRIDGTNPNRVPAALHLVGSDATTALPTVRPSAPPPATRPVVRQNARGRWTPTVVRPSAPPPATRTWSARIAGWFAR